MRTISHDPFARESIVRKSVPYCSSSTCKYCGSNGKAQPTHNTFVLYRYGIERDDRPGENNVKWSELYCSISCWRSCGYR